MEANRRRVKGLPDLARFAIVFAHGGVLLTGIVAIALSLGLFVQSDFSADKMRARLRPKSQAVGQHIAQQAPLEKSEDSGSKPGVDELAAAGGREDRQSAVASAGGRTRPPVHLDEAHEPDQVRPVPRALRPVVADLSRRYKVAGSAVEPYVAEAAATGRKLNLDPLLIVAVMAIESRFNPIAESERGALGLMQVMPKFHEDKLAAVVRSPNAPGAFLKPSNNIRVGARVLKEAIARAGSLPGGLQAYAGASGDSAAQYSGRVLAEKQRLQQVLRDSRKITVAGL